MRAGALTKNRLAVYVRRGGRKGGGEWQTDGYWCYDVRWRLTHSPAPPCFGKRGTPESGRKPEARSPSIGRRGRTAGWRWSGLAQSRSDMSIPPPTALPCPLPLPHRQRCRANRRKQAMPQLWFGTGCIRSKKKGGFGEERRHTVCRRPTPRPNAEKHQQRCYSSTTSPSQMYPLRRDFVDRAPRRLTRGWFSRC